MKTDMVLSCPKCGAENTVSMKIMESANRIGDIISMMIPGAQFKQYSFYGETKCVCGETINALLTVGTGKQVIR